MPPTTQDQLNARLTPQATQIQTPTQGLFRGVGDFGSAIYGTDSSGKLVNYNLIGDNSGLWKDSADRTSFGNAGGQAEEAIKRLKSQYGIDYNSLNQVNLADHIQQLGRRGIGSNNADGALTGYSVMGDLNSLRQSPQQSASLTSQTINNTSNQLNPLAVANQQAGQPQPTSFSQTDPSRIVNQSMGQTAGGNIIANGSTPFGSISNGTVSLGTNNNGVFTSDVLGSGKTMQGVLDKTQSYNDVINGYLKNQADAQSKLNSTQATALQGQANIMYGLNGAGGHDANLQGAEQQQFDRQMAFQTVPAQIALQNAQTGLALFKQSPEYQAQQQSLSTAQNLLQQYPDLGITYNPSLSPEQNLQAIQGAVSNSPRFQAMNSVLGVNPITGQPMIINKLGSRVTSTSVGGGGNVGGGGTPTSTTSYVPGSQITRLPPGVSSIGSSVMDQTAISLFNGTIAPGEVKGRGLQTDAMLSQANKISLALTGKPFDAAAAQSAYDFRQTSKYQGYMSSAPTAIRNIQAMRDDAEKLKLGGITGINWTKINLMASGMWFGTAEEKATAADLVSKYNQSKDDIGLLLGTGQGSDAKIALGGLIFTPAGAPYTTQQLATNVSNTILSKMGDYYRQAGVKDPTPYLSKDTAQIWQNFQGSQSSAQKPVSGLNSTSQSILQKYGIK